MRVFVRFSTQPFYGELTPVYTLEDLYNQVKSRVGLLDLLNDEQGHLRSHDSFTEEELLEVFKGVSRHDEIHLVSGVNELVQLSEDEGYQNLVGVFMAHYS